MTDAADKAQEIRNKIWRSIVDAAPAPSAMTVNGKTAQQVRDESAKAWRDMRNAAASAPAFGLGISAPPMPAPLPPGGISAPVGAPNVAGTPYYMDPPKGKIFGDATSQRIKNGGSTPMFIPDAAHPAVVGVSLGWLAHNGCACKWCVRMREELICEAKPAAEKPVKPIHEMTFADYQKGVDAWWPNRRKA